MRRHPLAVAAAGGCLALAAVPQPVPRPRPVPVVETVAADTVPDGEISELAVAWLAAREGAR